jgi:hypothetical protein
MDIDRVIYQDCAMILATYESVVDLDYPRQQDHHLLTLAFEAGFRRLGEIWRFLVFPDTVRPTGNERFFY